MLLEVTNPSEPVVLAIGSHPKQPRSIDAVLRGPHRSAVRRVVTDMARGGHVRVEHELPNDLRIVAERVNPGSTTAVWIGIFGSAAATPARPPVETFTWRRGDASTSTGLPVGVELHPYDFGDREEKFLAFLLAGQDNSTFTSEALRRGAGMEEGGQLVHFYARAQAADTTATVRDELSFVVMQMPADVDGIRGGRSLSALVMHAIQDPWTFRCVLDRIGGVPLRWHGSSPLSMSWVDKSEGVDGRSGHLSINVAAGEYQTHRFPAVAMHDDAGKNRLYCVECDELQLQNAATAVVLSFSPTCVDDRR